MADVIDLYCGAGGWGVALNRLGLSHHGYDNNRDAIDTYRLGCGPGYLVDLTTHFTYPSGIEGIVASPPCQPFSKAGKQQGRNDPRGRHALIVAGWAAATRPKWIAVEQVPGAHSMFNRLAVGLSDLGYHVATYGLDAETFGVPQTRHRIIMLARKDKKPGKPVATHSKFYPHSPHRLDPGVKKWVTMADALGWGLTHRPYPTIAPGTGAGGADLEGVGGTGSRARLAAERQAGRWVYERPSPTIVGSFRPDIVAKPNWRVTGSRQYEPDSVHITPAEGGILQSFPPDYPWQGSRTSKFTQVGNAIPPLMAQAVIEAVMS